MDGIERTIRLACTAFHAGLRVDKICKPASHLECTMRTNFHADPAPGAESGVILKGVGLICVEHDCLRLAYKNDPDVKKKSSAEHPGHGWNISEHFTLHTTA